MIYNFCMTRNLIFSPDCYYHVYDRGTEKRKIFLDPGDYERFMALIYVCNSKAPVRMENLQRKKVERGRTLLKQVLEVVRVDTVVDVCAYCLMPNHFHFVLKERESGGISKFMQKLMTAYTMYFNKKYGRSGALFQGKFKATHASDDNYLKYLMAYVHLNPVKLIDPTWKESGIKDEIGARRFLQGYRYSSYVDYCETRRPESTLVNTDGIPEYYESGPNFESAVAEWLSYASEQGSTLLKFSTLEMIEN